MLRLTEYRTKEEGLADRLNYAAMIDDGVMLCKDGSLMACWSFRGQDLASSTSNELAAIAARLNSGLRFGSGWMLHCDAIRRKAPGYPSRGAFPDRTTLTIDEERRMQFMAEGAHFESTYALDRVIPILRQINKSHLLVVIFFENTEIAALARQEAATVEDIYRQTVAQQFLAEKTQMVLKLRQYGIQSVLTPPQDLSIHTINKYLEMKSKGLI